MIKRIIKRIWSDAFPDVDAAVKKAVDAASKEWDEWHAAHNKKPDWRQSMVFVFNLDGHDFHKFTAAAEMPLNRLERMQELLIMMDNRLTRDEFVNLLNIAKNSFSEMVNSLKQKNRIEGGEKAMWAIEEMMSRNERLMFHPGLLMELAALTIIRDDEDPTIINEDIHQWKKEQFRQRGGDVDFFMKTGADTLIPSVKVSPDNWKKLWEAVERTTEYTASTYQKIAGGTKFSVTGDS